MTISKRNTLVQLQRRTSTQDAAGQPLNTWEPVGAQVWADIRAASGLATIRAGADVSVVKVSIRILRRSDVLPGMRVLAGAVVYEIEAVPPPRAGSAEMDLVCKVVT